MPDAERESVAADFRDIAEHDPIIRQRLVDTGQIMNMLRPAEFAANIKEQNDQLAAIARSLGLKQ
jgi:tripartite-type tricarboxylate transporter receptor subunit TctC